MNSSDCFDENKLPNKFIVGSGHQLLRPNPQNQKSDRVDHLVLETL